MIHEYQLAFEIAQVDEVGEGSQAQFFRPLPGT